MIIKNSQLKLGSIRLDVIRKDIKNIHLSVYPPTGRVRIAVPLRMNPETVRVFAISKLGWIKKQQKKFLGQEREPKREYLTRESHYFLGKRYLLKVLEENAVPSVAVKHDTIELSVRPKTGAKRKQVILNDWYRLRLKEIVPKIIERYENILKIKVDDFAIRRMKTKWGTCNREAKRIWLNLELAKKPLHYIEYIVLHEMIHLLERCHNVKFTAYMDKFMSQWRRYKEELNRAPLGHVKWGY